MPRKERKWTHIKYWVKITKGRKWVEDKNRNEEQGQEETAFPEKLPRPSLWKKEATEAEQKEEVRVTFLLITVHQFIIISILMVKCDSFKATWYFLVAIFIVRAETGFEYLG